MRNALLGVVATLIGGLLLAAGFLGRVITEPARAATTASGPAAAAAANGTLAQDFAILPEIATVLGQDFVAEDRATPDALRDGAIKGIFDALGDPHSVYLDPQTYALSKGDFEGAFEGIGATVSKQGDFLVIVRPLPGTPAARAGLRAGDIILAVDGETAEGWSVEQGVLRIRGPLGTTVQLKIHHSDGQEETLAIKRDSIAVDSVSADPPGGSLHDAAGNVVTDLAYIRIHSFTRSTPEEFRKAVKAAETSGVKGLLLDVRGNPGGLLTETIQVADDLLERGAIVTQVDRDGNEQSASARSGTITRLPIAILQDEFSASGAELLAAALKENGRATVVGSRSFGKGTVNHVRELSNGGAVYVSIARWLTPARNQIEGQGVIPDVEVKLTADDISANRDLATLKAIDVLRAAR